MRILYVGHKFDYGIPERGFSFEHYNLFDALLALGHEILYFDLGLLRKPELRQKLNARLLEIAQSEKPDLMFTVLFENELDRATVAQISRSDNTATINWFCDDHWRFENYSRLWAPCFNWVVTTAQSAVAKYQRIGYRNAIKSQWACNAHLYQKMDAPLVHDMTFIGQPHGNRRAVINAIRAAGLDVKTWGTDWEAGRLEQGEMTLAFNQSRINLNLSNASQTPGTRLQKIRARTLYSGAKAMNFVPFGRKLKSIIKGGGDKRPPPGEESTSAPMLKIRTSLVEQIKGRNFEVPGCGGFMMTGQADDLESYFKIDREIVCFDSLSELLEKAKYYLSHETERAAIAEAGYRRTIAEHTYAHRFKDIFQRMGIDSPPASGADGKVDYLLD